MYIFWLPIFLEDEKINKKEKQRINEIIKLRNKRDQEYVLAQYFYDNLASYLKVKFNNIKLDFTLCSPDELIALLKGHIFNEKKIREIKSREKGAVIFQSRVFSFLKTKKEINKFLSDYNLVLEKENKVKPTDKIMGQSANSGQARGRVVLLFSKNEMNKVDEETIVVSPMTTPYLNPALKKCQAIVTDEGGITCHAAIIARELKKPCIIGTKIATKVLKDGDKVLVDADKGIVKKL